MAKFPTVKALEEYLTTRSYITGYSLTEDDKTELAALSGGIPSIEDFPNVYRWASHIVALTGVTVIAKAATGANKGGKKAVAAPAAADDFDDMFGGDDEDVDENGETAEERAATKARQERMEAARKLKEEKDAKDGKKKKEKAVEKSLIVLEVKPWEADTDLEAVWKKIIEYKQEGLTWGESFKLEPIAYGVKKLVMTCVIIDALVLQDDITDCIEALDEFVQSANVVSMNKV